MLGGDSHNHRPEQSLHMKENDKFFSRLLSKETSVANSSCRVPYYGRESGAVPFMWESRPGTPKHTFSEASLPPLTPPPSYYSTSKLYSTKKNSKPDPFYKIFLKLTSRKALVSPSSSLSSVSSSSLSSWSSAYNLSPPASMKREYNLGRYSSSYPRSTTSSTSCFGARHRTSNWFGCCYPMKNTFLSIVGHGSSGRGTAQGLFV
ncbi:uncharacterized protein LOC121248734 [Juglans microcarpa x Juglans regia]|uniref:uncharacterized protein LOC121248734 n=1 Tax=Juglans microcarpa x Juglans regia TaxID=2249226 RepID=UPI001B7DAD80|nr:uncharacterized protein LOC121248734 [Juglans microcarpa x Juglans regia]